MSDISWKEVWDAYRVLEEDRWREHYQSRGFDTWSAWRGEYAKAFGLETRRWTLESIVEPIVEVSGWWVGAYKGWRQYYPADATQAQFHDITASPALRENNGVLHALNHVPELTRFILFRCGDEIVVRDGTHRAAAIALRALDGLPYPGRLEAAVAWFNPSERDLFLQAYDQRFARTVERR